MLTITEGKRESAMRREDKSPMTRSCDGKYLLLDGCLLDPANVIRRRLVYDWFVASVRRRLLRSQ